MYIDVIFSLGEPRMATDTVRKLSKNGYLGMEVNNRRVFVGSIGSDCNPIRTVIFS